LHKAGTGTGAGRTIYGTCTVAAGQTSCTATGLPQTVGSTDILNWNVTKTGGTNSPDAVWWSVNIG